VRTKNSENHTLILGEINPRGQLREYLRLVDEQVMTRRQQVMMLLKGSLERG
jgi:hypothetical protein